LPAPIGVIALEVGGENGTTGADSSDDPQPMTIQNV
jgi:hypothetical protein